MKVRLLLICALVAMFALVVSAADVAGKWTSEMQGRDGQTRTTTFNFKVDGSKLTGTVSGGRGGDVEISDGKVSGDEVSFNVVREFQGNKVTSKYSGKVSGSEMKLKVETEGMGGGGGGGKGGPREITLKKATT